MKYNVIGYFLSEGFRNVFKNKKSTFSCLGVMCATMLLFGLFFAFGKNINNAVDTLEQEQGMQVFMEYDANEDEINALKEKCDSLYRDCDVLSDNLAELYYASKKGEV